MGIYVGLGAPSLSKQFFRDIQLFIKNPREYLFSFTYSKEKQITVSRYDPSVTDFGNTLVKKIQHTYPHMKVNFYGSAALGIAGQRDIDLVIECARPHLKSYTQQLRILFGEPVKMKSQFSEWSFEKKRCEVQILLIVSKHPIAFKTRKSFHFFKKNKPILEEYEAVKLASDGATERQYEREKLKFFSDKGL